MPFIVVSSGKVTSCSTSSGAMPPASVSSVTVGRFRSGNTSTGVLLSVKMPYAIITAANNITSIRLRSELSTSHLNMVAP